MKWMFLFILSESIYSTLGILEDFTCSFRNVHPYATYKDVANITLKETRNVSREKAMEELLQVLVDDVEFWFPPGKKSIVQYRAASRLGNYDFDANRRIKNVTIHSTKNVLLFLFFQPMASPFKSLANRLYKRNRLQFYAGDVLVDLENDYINPYDSASEINILVVRICSSRSTMLSTSCNGALVNVSARLATLILRHLLDYGLEHCGGLKNEELLISPRFPGSSLVVYCIRKKMEALTQFYDLMKVKYFGHLYVGADL
ncbi:hypothetical protein HAX54_050877 [Datura stramonium]|uniref:Uncharacterized protein n=1 Tax=Datura stramonium TaxID=4076 RepID=A0ABS8SXQ5_DATST|nr:hypothetical protein [Datura stramonium]